MNNKQTAYHSDVIILGSRISGSLTAALLQRDHPDLRITIVAPENKKLPVVGESLTEFSSHMIRKIGLGEYLENDQYNKYGLTFYYKEDLDNPKCRKYSVHEAPAVPPMVANQLNRFTFDKKINQVLKERSIQFIDATANGVEIGQKDNHRLNIKTSEGEQQTRTCKWLVDCSGRARFLARQLHLKQKSEHQRSTYWFRLVGFDRELIKNLDAAKEQNDAFDSYFATHHFMGRGYWIWCIPMRSEDGQDMMSIGMVYQPDILTTPILNIEDFIHQVKEHHPVLIDLIDSGSIVENSLYRNYMYEASKLYSNDRWFIAGDAGETVDPLFSTGIVMTCIQMQQISEMIATDKTNGEIGEDYAHDLEAALRSYHRLSQRQISRLYRHINDPYQASWSIHLASTLYFFCFLPMWLSGYMTDRVGSKLYRKISEISTKKGMAFETLLKSASEKLGPIAAEDLENQYNRTVNWDLNGPNDKKIPSYLRQLAFLMASLRFRFLRESGWKDWPGHMASCIEDVVVGCLMATIFRNKSLKASRLISRLVKNKQIPNRQPSP